MTHLESTILQLRAISQGIDRALARARAKMHEGMWEVSPGVWISNDFCSLDEALQWLSNVIKI
jgi:hypothetical protein